MAPQAQPRASDRDSAGGEGSLQSLTVVVTAIRYRSPDGEFAVLDARSDADGDITLTGALTGIAVGEELAVEGRWREHPQHGLQLHALSVRPQEPTSLHAIEAYIGQIKHIGPRGAAFLVGRHGHGVLEAIDRAPRARLLEVPGIGRARVPGAVRSWEEQRALRAVRLFFAEHGVGAAVAARVYRALGTDSIALLRDDPYRITELEGIGFATADALAQALGVSADAPRRLDAGLLHALSEAELDGHCHLPRAELCSRAQRLLGVNPDPRIDVLAQSGRLALAAVDPRADPAGGGEELVADASMDRIERSLAARVRSLADAPPCLDLHRVTRPTRGARSPTDAQWSGVESALEHRLSIVTGGPGTGKTTAMRALVDLLRANRRAVRLCAPTGKAARRLAAATGADACTIHRLLEWVPGEGFARGPENPIDDADLLIVDEASMLGVRLAEALLGAVGPRTHVLFVGDVDQLAPVGPGRVLEDLIASGEVPVTRLREIFRQAARSLIVRAAHAINQGHMPATDLDAEVERDFFFIRRDSETEIFREVISLATTRLAAHLAVESQAAVQVLAPMHRGTVGIDALNEALRAELNPDGAPVSGTSLRIGDRVIQTRNDHEHELMNGEIGLVLASDEQRQRVLLATDDGRRLALPHGALATLRLAYAVSIHKAQGSQSPAVVIPLARAHSIMLTRNLLYTAITRAERMCVLVGEPAALRIALSRRDARRRYTRLGELITGAADAESEPGIVE